ncbi:SOS response-associated peptidase [Hydrogenophaga sp.]|uniref:SOS response-associated peptidase n=1 Tax=Hydrogenophaga sp. TaxID=1904254 RepID=UPI003D1269BA
MCNLYTTLDGDEILRYFRREPPRRDYKPAIGPLQDGPFIRAGGEVVVGQWGLIPSPSPTRTPSTPDGKRRLSTNNCRREGMARSYAFGPSWRAGRRCLIPAWAFVEPYYAPGAAKSVRWQFARADGQPWALAGLWNEWTDHHSGEIVPSYTMITQNCDDHPLLKLMHKPELDEAGQLLAVQDKRTVVPIEQAHWDTWLHGSADEVEALIVVPELGLFEHGAMNPAQQMFLPITL